jgi:ABC-type dipeptide/oligopeptide/nickel transport system permease component
MCDPYAPGAAPDYITTARERPAERGCASRLPNALLPVSTIVGMNVGTMLSGSVLVEVVFAWPGMGRLLYDGVLARDYPLIIGIILIVSVAVVLVNLITDVVYAIVDPRIRYD